MLGHWNLDTGTYYALFYAFSGFLSVAPVITELFNHLCMTLLLRWLHVLCCKV